MYADEKGIPWGISECAFAKVEDNGAYGYRAFGVPQLALHQDEERLVVAPYATMLALGIDPPEAIRNLRWMTKKGWFGTYGYYEAADFTAGRAAIAAPAFRTRPSWMVHHQGMSLLAIANFLNHGVVQRWFASTRVFRRPSSCCRSGPQDELQPSPSRKTREQSPARKSRLALVAKT